MQKLNVAVFEKALAQLDVSLKYALSEQAKQDPQAAELFRSASIQAFEFCFEIATKLLWRALTAYASSEEVDQMSYRDRIRLAAESGLVQDPEAWFGFRDMRNRTTHAYDAKIAAEVYADIPRFLQPARNLLEMLKQKHAS